MEEGDYCGCYCLLKGHYAKCYRPTALSMEPQRCVAMCVCVCVYEFESKVVCEMQTMCVLKPGQEVLAP